MNVVTSENLANAVRDIIVQTSIGIRAARDLGHIVRNPETIEISGTLLIQENAVTLTSSSATVEPESSITETRTTPEVVTVSTEERPETTSTTTRTDGAGGRTETYQPPTTDSVTTRSGGNTSFETTTSTTEL